jgi:hypothetical protein
MSESDLHSLQWCVFEGALGCIMTSMCIAVKVFEDTLWSNKCWSKLSGFPLAEVNALELAAFQRLNFSAFVSPEEYLEFIIDFCSSRCSSHSLHLVSKMQRQKAKHKKSLVPPSFSFHSLTDLPTSFRHHSNSIAGQTIPAKEILDERKVGPNLSDIIRGTQRNPEHGHASVTTPIVQDFNTTASSRMNKTSTVPGFLSHLGQLSLFSHAPAKPAVMAEAAVEEAVFHL